MLFLIIPHNLRRLLTIWLFMFEASVLENILGLQLLSAINAVEIIFKNVLPRLIKI